MPNQSEYLGAGNASQPEIFRNSTSQQVMQFSGSTDLRDETEENESDPEGKLFGTHINEAVEVAKDWISAKNRSE